MKKVRRGLWYPTQAKTRLEWGTQPVGVVFRLLLPVKEAASLYSYRSAAMGSIRMARVAGG